MTSVGGGREMGVRLTQEKAEQLFKRFIKHHTLWTAKAAKNEKSTRSKKKTRVMQKASTTLMVF